MAPASDCASPRLGSGGLASPPRQPALERAHHLGIIIGVGAVIAMVSVGAGARARVAEQLRKLGPDLIYAMGRDSVCGRARLAGARIF